MLHETKIDKYGCFILNHDSQNDTRQSAWIFRQSSAFYIRYWNPDVATEQCKTFVSAQSSILPTNEKWFEYRGAVAISVEKGSHYTTYTMLRIVIASLRDHGRESHFLSIHS